MDEVLLTSKSHKSVHTNVSHVPLPSTSGSFQQWKLEVVGAVVIDWLFRACSNILPLYGNTFIKWSTCFTHTGLTASQYKIILIITDIAMITGRAILLLDRMNLSLMNNHRYCHDNRPCYTTVRPYEP